MLPGDRSRREGCIVPARSEEGKEVQTLCGSLGAKCSLLSTINNRLRALLP